MKKIIISAFILTSLLSCSNNDKPVKSKTEDKTEVQSKTSNDEINLEHSTVYWKGTKAIGGGHQGTVKFANGKMDIQDDVLKSGRFIIDMNTIVCKDIKDPESNADLVGHLKSDDFFSVSTYPTAEVEIVSAEALENGEYKCSANIIIKDVKKQSTFNVKVEKRKGKYVMIGRMNLDRTKFGVVYNSGNIFKSLGDKVINDDIMIKFEVIEK